MDAVSGVSSPPQAIKANVLRDNTSCGTVEPVYRSTTAVPQAVTMSMPLVSPSTS